MTPKCTKCGNGTFEFSEIQLKNGRYINYACICSSCGAVANIMDYLSNQKILDEIQTLKELLVNLNVQGVLGNDSINNPHKR